jgi:quercetin dioxygenase-like cupin family protein
MYSIQKWTLLLTIIFGMFGVGALLAQNPGIKRTIVKTQDVSGGRQAVIATVTIAPGTFAGRHTHPGEEISYVMEGEGEVLIEGQPPLPIKAGDGFVVPAGAVHDAHNTGSVPIKLAAVYYVEKGKPLATPAK